MKEYAEILYPEKEKQAEYLKNEADKLREQGETGEAIMIYKFIGQEYPLTNKDKGSLLQLGEIFKNEMDKEKVIFYYSQVMQKYEPFITESEWWEIIKNFDFLKQYYKAIELSEKFLQKFEDSKYREDILFTLGNLYRKIGEIKKAQNVWEIYIKEYPTSIKNNMIEKFFKEEVKK
jgi:TolA-binding protein